MEHTVLYCTIENSKLWTLRFGDSCSIAPEPKKGRFLEKPELSRGLENKHNEVSHTHTSSKGRFSTERDHYYRGGYRSRLYCLRTFSTLTVTPSDCWLKHHITLYLIDWSEANESYYSITALQYSTVQYSSVQYSTVQYHVIILVSMRQEWDLP